MSDDLNKPELDQVEDNTEVETSGDDANLIDEITEANFRIEELEQALAEANAKVEEQKDSVVRAAAEVENMRRRAAMDVEKARKFALEKFVNELLPVIDNMDRAVQETTNLEDETAKVVCEGVTLTHKTLLSAVEKFGVTAVDPQGQAFDPDKHQAIGMQPSSEYPANTVMMVMQKGFVLNDRLLRPAMVMVSQGGGSVDTEA